MNTFSSFQARRTMVPNLDKNYLKKPHGMIQLIRNKIFKSNLSLKKNAKSQCMHTLP